MTLLSKMPYKPNVILTYDFQSKEILFGSQKTVIISKCHIIWREWRHIIREALYSPYSMCMCHRVVVGYLKALCQHFNLYDSNIILSAIDGTFCKADNPSLLLLICWTKTVVNCEPIIMFKYFHHLLILVLPVLYYNYHHAYCFKYTSYRMS